jgi:hypothetical protein
MEYTHLGCTELQVSRIALGLWQAGGDWGAMDEANETATIRRALDRGSGADRHDHERRRTVGRALPGGHAGMIPHLFWRIV